MIRQEYLKAALGSFRELSEVIDQLTEAELHEALSVESSSQRRPVALERMVQRLCRLIEIRTREDLTRRYLHGP